MSYYIVNLLQLLSISVVPAKIRVNLGFDLQAGTGLSLGTALAEKVTDDWRPQSEETAARDLARDLLHLKWEQSSSENVFEYCPYKVFKQGFNLDHKGEAGLLAKPIEINMGNEGTIKTQKATHLVELSKALLSGIDTNMEVLSSDLMGFVNGLIKNKPALSDLNSDSVVCQTVARLSRFIANYKAVSKAYTHLGDYNKLDTKTLIILALAKSGLLDVEKNGPSVSIRNPFESNTERNSFLAIWPMAADSYRLWSPTSFNSTGGIAYLSTESPLANLVQEIIDNALEPALT